MRQLLRRSPLAWQLALAATLLLFLAAPFATGALRAVSGVASVDTSPTMTSNWTFSPASGIGIVVNSTANTFGLQVHGISTGGQSYGIYTNAGTSAADNTIDLRNYAQTRHYFNVTGDGAGVLGWNGTTNTISWTAAGAMSVAAPTAGPSIAAAGFAVSGTTFTLGSGTGACATTSTLTGGAAGGSFLCTGTAGASTQIINLPTFTNGWSCWASDVTSGVVWAQVIPIATNSAKLTGTIATTGDRVVFGCVAF